MCEFNNVTNAEHRDVVFLASMQFSEKLPGYERYILDILLKKTEQI